MNRLMYKLIQRTNFKKLTTVIQANTFHKISINTTTSKIISNRWFHDDIIKKDGETKIVKLLGLPWSVTKQDILNFFVGIPIMSREEGIHMQEDVRGRQIGIAFIELENAEDLLMATMKHRQYIGSRYIEVVEGERTEMERVIRANETLSPVNDCCILLSGLPYGCSKSEIVKFFSGLEIAPNGINFLAIKDKETCKAFVKFINEDTIEKAMEKHNELIGHRHVEICKSNLNHRVSMNSQNNVDQGRHTESLSCVIKMKGLPYSATEFDIRKFFSPLNPVRIWIPSGDYQRNRLGLATVEFNSHGDAVEAMDKDRMHIGERYIELNLKTNEDADRNADARSIPSNAHTVHMRGLPFSTVKNDIAKFFSPLNPVNIWISMNNRRNEASGNGIVEFNSHDEAVDAMSRDNNYIEHRYIKLSLESKRPSVPVSTDGGNISSGEQNSGDASSEQNHNRGDDSSDQQESR